MGIYRMYTGPDNETPHPEQEYSDWEPEGALC